MRIVTIFITVLLSTLVLSTTDAVAEEEIYRWVDENGVIHFGSRPEGPSEAELVKIQAPPEGTNQANSEPVPTDADEAQPSYAQQQREQRAQSRQSAAEKQRELDVLCKQHHQAVAELEPMTRVMVEQEDGTVIRMDDNVRLEKLRESKTFIAENCNN